MEFEAVVVGSGFGGAVAACRLAQAGFRTLILERGRRYEPNDFPALPDGATFLPDLRRWRWGTDQGLWDVVDLEEIVSIQAAGYGGGSLVYANVHLRPPREVFDDRWPAAYRGGEALEPFYDLAAHMLEVAPIDAHPALRDQVVKVDQLEQAARHLGRATFHPPLAIRHDDGPNIHGKPQKRCTGCGNCCTGCPHEAKNTLDLNYLAVAERHGATARTQCEVTGLRHLAADGWEVRYTDHLQAADLAVRCRYVFLCAGAIHTARLLARARLPEGARRAQALVGTGYFPGGDALGIVYDTAHEQFPSFGPTIATTIVHWDERREGSFFLIQDGGYGKQVERLTGLLRAPAWVGRNRLSRTGPAAVARSAMTPPRPGASGPPGARPPLDSVLDAVAHRAFQAALGPDVRACLSSFVDELKLPLLFPEVVDATIGRALEERYRRGWLTRRLDPRGPILRAVTRATRWIAYTVFGDASALSGHALRAMLAGGDLGRAEWGSRVLGCTDAGADRRAVLLAMGRDAASGVLHVDPRGDRIVADLDLFDLAPGYARQEQVMIDLAGALGGELRTNPAWAFLGKPVTVHNQGGCRMSDSEEDGVTTDEGKVRGCDGLYVLDGAVLCTSVGTNPSATILAIAERNVLAFIRAVKGSAWPEGDPAPGAEGYRLHREGAARWRARAQGWDLRPPRGPHVAPRSQPVGVRFHEVMEGAYAPTDVAPRGDGAYLEQETRGRAHHPLRLELDVSVENLAAFLEDEHHRMRVAGVVRVRLPSAGRKGVERCEAEGTLDLLVPRRKPYALGADDPRRAAQARAAGRRYTAHRGAPPRSRTRFLKYDLAFADSAGRAWRLRGYKRVRRDPGVDAWRATSTLFTQLHGPFADVASARRGASLCGAGAVHVDLSTFLFEQIPSMRVTGTDDPARKTWALATFSTFFFASLQRIYLPEIRWALDAVVRAQLGETRFHPATTR